MNSCTQYRFVQLLFCAWPLLSFGQPGMPDLSFGDQGTVLMPLVEPFIQNGVGSLVEYPDGRILLAGGIFMTGPSEIYLARIQPDGQMDLGFGTGGVRLHSIGASSDGVSDMILLPDGKFMLSGSADDTAVVSRYFENGDPDPTFGANGLKWLGFPGTDSRVGSMHRMPDGRITLMLLTDTSIHLARILPDGAMDMDFSDDGQVQVASVPGSYIRACMALDGQGNILISRENAFVSDSHVVIERWLVSGDHDASFGDGGQRIIDLSQYADVPWSVVPLQNGSALFTGETWTTANESAFIAELDPNGDPIPSYGDNGIALLPALEDSSYILRSSVLQPDGALIMAGVVSHWGIGAIATVRLSPNGSLDLSYGANGTALAADPDPNGEGVSDVIMSSSGSLIMSIGFGGLYRGAARKILTGLEVGITETDLDALQGSLFPNPAVQTTTLRFNKPHPGTTTIALHAMDGRLIQNFGQVSAVGGENSKSLVLPVSIASGTYFVRLITPDGIANVRLSVQSP